MKLNQELLQAVKELIKNGTRYYIEKLEKIYHDDLRIARIEGDDIQVINKKENLAFFKSRRDNGEKSLSPETSFRYAHASGRVGHVVLDRKMKLHDKKEHLLYNIVLRKVDGDWKVVSEFVIPLN